MQKGGTSYQQHQALLKYVTDKYYVLLHSHDAVTRSCWMANAGNTHSCPNLLIQKGIPNIDIKEYIPLTKNALTNIKVMNFCIAAVHSDVLTSPSFVAIPCNKTFFASFACIPKFGFSPQLASSKHNRHSFQLEIKSNEALLLPSGMICPSGWSRMHDNLRCLHLIKVNSSITSTFDLQVYRNACEEYKLIPYEIQEGQENWLMDSTSYLHYFEKTVVVTKIDGSVNCSAHIFMSNYVKIYSDKSDGKSCFEDGFPRSFRCHKQCKVSVLCSENSRPWVMTKTQKLNTYKCWDGTYILGAWLCDNIAKDCNHNDDEYNCSHTYLSPPNDGSIMTSTYSHLMFDHEQLCGSECDMTVQDHCSYLYFACPTGGCVPLNSLCDGYANCQDAADESLCKQQSHAVGNIEQRYNATKLSLSPSWLNVSDGYGYFYRFCDESYLSYSQLCVYDPGEHFEIDCYIYLHAKCLYVSCPLNFKCHSSFCIPIRKVCDGVVDCFYGEDESFCLMITCKGLFQCRNESYCLPPWEVCDGTIHCPKWGDDELYCSKCPAGCQCHGNAVYCNTVTASLNTTHLQQLCQYTGIKALIYRASAENIIDHICHPELMIYLVMQRVTQHLLSVNRSDTFPELRYLDLTHNTITMIPPCQLSGCNMLSILNLAYNKLLVISNGSFTGLFYLHTLILSNNEITTIQTNVFCDVVGLQKLFIDMNNIAGLSTEHLPPSNSLTVLTSDFAVLCCLQIDAYCSPNIDTLSLCYNVLSVKSMQALIFLQSFTIIVMNSVSIYWDLKHPNVEIVQLLNLHFADILMGISFCLMISFHFNYTNRFMDVILSWKQHWVCNLVAAFSFLSSQAGLLITLCMLLQRIVNLRKMKAVGPSSSSRQKNILSYASLWVICCGVCISLVLLSKENIIATEHSTNFCFLIDPLSQTLATKMSQTAVGLAFIIINILGLVIILSCYIFLGKTLWHSLYVSRRKLGTTKMPFPMGLIKIGILVFSLLYTYLPFIILCLLALGAYDTDSHIAEWIIILTVPFASLINPFIHTFLPLALQLRQARSIGSHKQTLTTQQNNKSKRNGNDSDT